MKKSQLPSTMYAKGVIEVLEAEIKALEKKYYSLKFYQVGTKKIYLNMIDKYKELLMDKYAYYERLLDDEFNGKY